MAGSISLSLSQQFDELGEPLAGGLLYFIEAGTTSTPQNAFQDYDLAITHPNPLTLDAAGRVPQLFFADGFIKIRLTNSDGVPQITADNILVVGPSSGSGGGGSVDPTTVFQTGDVMWLDYQGTRTGWVRDNGRTIGSATSGATERANADTSALFTYLWTNFSNTVCAVSGGRGASAAADYAANKTIALPDKRGYVHGGLDDMGNSAAGRYANVPVVSGDVLTAGSVIGEATHTLAKASLPTLIYTAAVTDPGHDHAVTGGTKAATGTVNSAFGGGGQPILSPPSDVDVSSATTGITVGVTADAGNGAHNNQPKTVLGSFFRKL